MSRKTAGELGTRISRLLYILSMFQTLGSKVGMAIPWLSMVIYPTVFLVLRSLQNLFCFNESTRDFVCASGVAPRSLNSHCFPMAGWALI